jgi:hypothetical protein
LFESIEEITMRKPSGITGWAPTVLAASITGIWTLGLLLPGPGAAQTSGSDSVIYLDQAWSQADREFYYNVSQGSAAMNYAAFMNLEVAGSQELFRSDANSDRFGLITQAANPTTNPDGLPVGLAKWAVPEGRWKGEYIGLNCSACHNAQLHYKGKKIRIDGGVGNTFDFVAYVAALNDALQATLKDAAKFDRLAARAGATSAEAKADLRKRVEADGKRVNYYHSTVLMRPFATGPARIDAISAIIGRLMSVEPNIPENNFTPLAPTKPPFLWNAPQGSWTQWRASKQDPIDRNLGEVMGVYMLMDLTSKTPEEGLFTASTAVPNLQKIEDLLERLAPPKWPEEIFGKIDRQKARAGEALFADYCASCHNAWPYTWTEANKYGKRYLEVGLVPQKYVGTDPTQFEDLRPYVLTRQLAPYVLPPFEGKEIVPTGVLYITLQRRIVDAALSKVKLSPEEELNLHGYREYPLPRPPSRVYKAAPRDGVWATPPFMHNGSVPNLYEMLLPAQQRSKTFYIGREFDPVKVGLDTTGASGRFLYDTTQRGNSNAGHSFENGPLGDGIVGPLLADEQRWALVEYLKSIPSEAGRVTPFGGPPNAVTGNAPWGKAPAR